jgi:phosphate starvation-inducible protein PhoH
MKVREGFFLCNSGESMQRKKTKSPKTPYQPEFHLDVKEITPKTETQQKVFDEYDLNKNLLLHGFPGTGKTFLSMYLTLDEILYEKTTPYKKLIIIRSAVPGRDQGFLPGNLKEKSKIYEGPYSNVVSELFGRGDAYELLKSKGIIEFETTMSLRGITFRNCIVFVDEIQNMTFQELDTIITRYGEKCKFIFSGDFRQNDLKKNEESGILKFINILNRVKGVMTIDFGIEDIVRSGLVKDYIIAKTDYEDMAQYK